MTRFKFARVLIFVTILVVLLISSLLIYWKWQKISKMDTSLLVHTTRHVGMYVRKQSISPKISDLHNMKMVKDQSSKLQWIISRQHGHSELLEKTANKLRQNNPHLFKSPQRILVFPGLLSYSQYNFAANAFKGGYLGELVQWSDLIACLFLLGHNISIETNAEKLGEMFPPKVEVDFDLVFTDYIGLYALSRNNLFAHYKCRLRIIDSFGSEPLAVFRTLDYVDSTTSDLFNSWIIENLKQFWTYYPHTPDNTFLGFIAETPTQSSRNLRKKNWAVIYGKDVRYTKGRTDYLKTLATYFDIQATFPENYSTSYYTNHGVLPYKELQIMLQSSKLFIGLGFPYEGPGPLEALANGCPFIQPRFNPPYNKVNNAFFAGKPTKRFLASQHPYLDDFIGEPYVYTVDAHNLDDVRTVARKILQAGPLKPFLPFEFTAEGFLERLGTLLLHQHFCDGSNIALNKEAKSSSSFAEHSPNEAVDGVLDMHTCWWSETRQNSWWSVDLQRETTIRKIRIYNSPDLLTQRSWGSTSDLAPFQVTLLDSDGQEIAKRTFTDRRVFYVWDDIFVFARHVVISSRSLKADKYMVLCGVEVYEENSISPLWPDWRHFKPEVSRRGESCKTTCAEKSLICEPAYFKQLNKEQALKEHFKCNDVVATSQYMDFVPAIVAEDDTLMKFRRGTCVINSEPLLYSCSGENINYIRLCPCRGYQKEQVALPPSS